MAAAFIAAGAPGGREHRGLATACLDDCVQAFERLERDYIAQDYEIEPGRKSPTPRHVSERFAANLGEFYGGRVRQVLATGRGPLS